MTNPQTTAGDIRAALRKQIRELELEISNLDGQQRDLLTRKRKLERQLKKELDRKYA